MLNFRYPRLLEFEANHLSQCIGGVKNAQNDVSSTRRHTCGAVRYKQTRHKGQTNCKLKYKPDSEEDSAK